MTDWWRQQQELATLRRRETIWREAHNHVWTLYLKVERERDYALQALDGYKGIYDQLRHGRDEAQMEHADAVRELETARAEIALWQTAYRNAFDAWAALKQEVLQDVDAKQAKLPPGND